MSDIENRLNQVIDEIIRAEGGYVNDPADRGGETMYGITVAVARANGYAGPMRNLPMLLARKIYRDRYIVTPKFDKVLEIDAAVGLELVDTGVNMGPTRPAEMLQRLLNALNAQARYQDLFVDGRIGGVTLDALRSFLNWRGRDGSTVLLRGLNSLQAGRYLEITESNPSQRKFFFGWLLNRVAVAGD